MYVEQRGRLHCSAHLSGWARIETFFFGSGFLRTFVAPTFRGGRGLKLLFLRVSTGLIIVAPTFRGGRGLKPLNQINSKSGGV